MSLGTRIVVLAAAPGGIIQRVHAEWAAAVLPICHVGLKMVFADEVGIETLWKNGMFCQMGLPSGSTTALPAAAAAVAAAAAAAATPLPKPLAGHAVGTAKLLAPELHNSHGH